MLSSPRHLLSAYLLFSLGATAQPTRTFRLALSPPFERQVRLSMEQTVTQSLPNNNHTVDQRTVLGQTFKVSEVDPEGAMTLWVRYDSVYHKVTTENPTSTLTMEFDSENPPDPLPPMAVGYAALVNKTFEVKVSSRGTVLQVTGVQEMLSSILDQLKVTDPEARQEALAQLKSRFGAQAIQETMQSLFPVYPEEPVAIGDSWSNTMAMSQSIPIQVANTWTLRQLGEDLAVVDLSSKVTQAEGASDTAEKEGTPDYRLSGTQSGTLRVDLETGWVVSTELQQDFQGTVLFRQGDESLDIPIALKGKVSLQPRP